MSFHALDNWLHNCNDDRLWLKTRPDFKTVNQYQLTKHLPSPTLYLWGRFPFTSADPGGHLDETAVLLDNAHADSQLDHIYALHTR